MNNNPTVATSQIPARGLSKTDRGQRPLRHSHSYGLWLRLADCFHGRHDARIASDAPIGALPWVKRLEATQAENLRRLLAGTRDMLAQDIITIEVSRATQAALHQTIADARQRQDAIQAAHATAGYGEQHLELGAIQEMRNREARGRRAAVAQEIARTSAAVEEAQRAGIEAQARVLEEFSMAVEVGMRMHAFYARRLQTYLHQFLRTRSDIATLQYQLEKPAWLTQPCPWVPQPAADATTAAPRLTAIA